MGLQESDTTEGLSAHTLCQPLLQAPGMWGGKTSGSHCDLRATPHCLGVHLFHASALLQGEGLVKAALCLGHLVSKVGSPAPQVFVE